MKTTALAFCALLLGSGTALAAGTPADGTYTCVMLSGSMLMTLGTLEIDGQRYRGFSPKDWADYTISGSGAITWKGGFSGMPDGFVLTDGQLTTDSRGKPYVQVNYTSPSGWKQTVDCQIE